MIEIKCFVASVDGITPCVGAIVFRSNELCYRPDEPVRVLVIDDSEDIHMLIKLWLSPLSIEVNHAYGGKEGIELAAKLKPALILLDYMMPDCNGLAVLEQLKANEALRDVPVIMITANNDRTLISEAFAKGVCDYVNKPLFADEFKARIATALRNQALLADLKYKSHYDSLTGLPNKLNLEARLGAALKRTLTSPEVIAVMFIDLDRFKLINDSLGHAFGDVMLQEAANRLHNSLQRSDRAIRCDGTMVARLGGDEFVVLLENIRTEDDAEAIAQRVLGRLLEPYEVDGRILFLGASIGIVTCNGQYHSSGDVIRDADIAMYEAKESGRGCYEVFDGGMRERARVRWKLDIDLRRAVELDQLYLVYQPIIDLQTGAVESVEALIRWQHPERGLIQPSYFIPLAEEMGMMVDIGLWVLRTACRQFVEWSRQSPHSVPRNVSINLSRQQLVHRSFVESYKSILHETGISASQVHLEITESEMMNELDSTVQVIESIRSLGTKIELDDFGTGYSSLACLHQIPLDVIKLDRSLISTIDQDGYLLGLARLVIQLLSQTQIKVVAEGIETEHQFHLLRELGCQFGQGYLFAKPMAADKVLEFVARERGVGFEHCGLSLSSSSPVAKEPESISVAMLGDGIVLPSSQVASNLVY